MYKIGDRIKIKDFKDIDIEARNYDGCFTVFLENMKKYCGKVSTIQKILLGGDFYLKENNYAWNKQWLEPYHDKFEEHKRRLLSV